MKLLLLHTTADDDDDNYKNDDPDDDVENDYDENQEEEEEEEEAIDMKMRLIIKIQNYLRMVGSDTACAIVMLTVARYADILRSQLQQMPEFTKVFVMSPKTMIMEGRAAP